MNDAQHQIYLVCRLALLERMVRQLMPPDMERDFEWQGKQLWEAAQRGELSENVGCLTESR